jgi:hypothetical protein
MQFLPLGNGNSLETRPGHRNEFSVPWIGSQLVCDDIAIEKCKKKLQNLQHKQNWKLNMPQNTFLTEASFLKKIVKNVFYTKTVFLR